MTYSYECKECGHTFDRNLPMDKRKEPLQEECPNCKAKGSLRRVIHNPTLVHAQGEIIDRCDSGWNDTLKRIKKASGKNNTIQTK